MRQSSWTKGVFLSMLLVIGFTKAAARGKKDYPIQPVPFTAVHINDTFWAPRLETNRTVTIPYAFRMNEETGRVDNFRKAAGLMPGPHKGKRYNDTDVFKAMEAASYSLLLHPDPALEKTLDDLIAVIAAAQEKDGYLYTARTIDPLHPADNAGAERWLHLSGSHELYNSGHLFEAAVAHHLATGKRNFLDIARKNADLLVGTFGPDKRHDVPGHQVVEMGLAKLYRVTGNRRYLELAKFFLDQRGKPHDGKPYPPDSPLAIYNDRNHIQDHLPVLEQTEAVGHAVRAMYMYSGMADVAAMGGYAEYVKAIDRLWENVVDKKLYLTGGVGARHEGESFGADYELPNDSAYCETCAAIGNVFFNQRMFLLHGESKYIDVLERTLYNGLISGVSLSGDRFFYPNPLESRGGYSRSPWFEVACCPANIARLLPSLSGYIYAVSGKKLYVNLFIGSRAQIGIMKQKLHITQETNYPWEGRIILKVEPEKEAVFSILVRIPGWSRGQPVPGDLYRYVDREMEGYSVRINGGIPIKGAMEKGYLRINRNWRHGDRIELEFPMPVQRVAANPKLAADAGKIALERGPLVYCLEGADNGGKVLDLTLPEGEPLQARFRSDLPGGMAVVTGKALRQGSPVAFTAIPYFAWAHRSAGEMAVWLPRSR